MIFNKFQFILVALVTLNSAVYADRTFDFKNNCPDKIFVGALGNPGSPAPNDGGWVLKPGASSSVTVSDKWAGRFWGRTNCPYDDNGNGSGRCETGDCGNTLKCSGRGGEPPVTLAEFTLDGDGHQDFYDVSNVDGFNLKLGISIKKGTYKIRKDDPYECGAPNCNSDILAICPPELQNKNSSGKVISCSSGCAKFNKPEYCCPPGSPFGTPQTCQSTKYAELFKKACPTAYSYAYDDKTSTYVCDSTTKPVYEITFCP